ncbi:MarR family winged helix-turn-helix transcriptional regulator [Microbacterium gorillae]|uniref:MarR family winged helix-turn-helix transcriptional regulator n=1 Tax=Microbacterium gorillae TaxID=1231063 RepID=UPI00058FA31B|nr:MarR family winged helix-turn-helix transcriptional regulator [Microbacterium gorillae]
MADSLSPADSPGLLLWRATLGWQRAIAAALRPLGLTHVQFVLLASAWWLTRVAGEEPRQGRIAEHANTDPMMTSQVVRNLADRGLLTRDPDPDDARARVIGVTDVGVDLAARAVAIVEQVDAEFFGVVADRGELLDILRRLAA